MEAEHWPVIRFPASWETYERIPNHPGWKWEYFGGEVVATPRPKSHYCVKSFGEGDPLDAVPPDLRDAETDGGDPVSVRRLADDDWDALPALLVRAFCRTAPFAQMPEGRASEVAAECMANVRAGKWGPLIGPASLVVEGVPSLRRFEDDAAPEPLGVVLVTAYRPSGDDDPLFEWRPAQDPPADWLDASWGRPHLTWAFVDFWDARHGLGTRLLTDACRALRDLGYGELTSTFLMGNDRSAFWHWRNGFRLLTGPYSMRRARLEARAAARKRRAAANGES